MREIVLDTETTGLSPLAGDRMVEIGCVEMINKVLTGRELHLYFNPQRSMPAAAEAVHGLSEAFLADKPLFETRCAEILEFLGDAPIVAHNAPFDFGFLNAELAMCGHPSVCMTRMVDTLVLARQKLPGAKHSLDALCTRFGVDRSIRVKHGALIDSQLLAQVYVELTGGRQIGLGLGGAVIEERITVTVVDSVATTSVIVRPPRQHAPTSEEIAAHEAFLAELDDPLWHHIESWR